jgi:hypothetical protein
MPMISNKTIKKKFMMKQTSTKMIKKTSTKPIQKFKMTMANRIQMMNPYQCNQDEVNGPHSQGLFST